MSYDLHVVRTQDWLESSLQPITKHDVDALVMADPELDWSKSDYVDMKDEIGVVTRYFMINWKNSPCYWRYRDQIMCSNPDKAQQIKLVEIAQALRAYILGDDHERYEVRKKIFGREKVIIVNPDDSKK